MKNNLYLNIPSASTRVERFTQAIFAFVKVAHNSLHNLIGIASSNLHDFLHDRSYLIQESVNTICATIILLIDDCADVTLSNPGGRSTIAQIILDLLLLIVTVLQSSITLTRGLGAVCLVVDKFAEKCQCSSHQQVNPFSL